MGARSMIITREMYDRADDLCMKYSEELAYCEKQIERMNNSFFSSVDYSRFCEYDEERRRLKAILEALQKYKIRIGVVDDKGVILVD